MSGQTKILVIVVGVAVLILGVVACVCSATKIYDLLFGDREPTQEMQPTDFPLATLPPPLSDVEFSTQEIDYPSGWPQEYHYPEPLILVEASSGDVPGGAAQGWVTMLRYEGQPEDASQLLTSFFLENDWRVVDQGKIETGGFLIMIEKHEREKTGIIIIDVDGVDQGSSKIMITITQKTE